MKKNKQQKFIETVGCVFCKISMPKAYYHKHEDCYNKVDPEFIKQNTIDIKTIRKGKTWTQKDGWGSYSDLMYNSSYGKKENL